jgi:hypothetical protein
MHDRDPAKTLVYHITHLENLAGIMARGLESDALRQAQATPVKNLQLAVKSRATLGPRP